MLIALLGEYHRAAKDFKTVLTKIPQAVFEAIKEGEHSDPDCLSIQTIAQHVVRSGFGYASYINTTNNRGVVTYPKQITTPLQAAEGIEQMLKFTEEALNGMWHRSDEQLASYSFETSWQVSYDIEQLLEHAIVHVLRHRRQVEAYAKQADQPVN